MGGRRPLIKNFGPMPFSCLRETPFLNRNGTTVKGTVILVHKRAGGLDPQDPPLLRACRGA